LKELNHWLHRCIAGGPAIPIATGLPRTLLAEPPDDQPRTCRTPREWRRKHDCPDRRQYV